MLGVVESMLFYNRRIKGIFLTHDSRTPGIVEMLSRFDIPKVLIGNAIEGLRCDRVCTANEEGAYSATMHLLRSGHENIAILCGDPEKESHRERIKGYKRALQEEQVEVRKEYIFDNIDGKVSAKLAMDKLLESVNKPSAIFVADLGTIVYVYQYIMDHGINCPKDLSIVCFNDFDWAEMLSPQTTTVKQDIEMIGREALRLMDRRLRLQQSGIEDEEFEFSSIPASLCVRNSSCGIGRGPFGECAGDPADLVLTEDEVAEIRKHKYTAAISFHYLGSSWALQQERGIRKIFDRLDIQIIAILDAHFDPELQSKQLRSLKILEPDVLISIPTDERLTADAYREFLDGHTKLVFISNIPAGFTPNDYVSCVSVNERSHGRNIGRGLGEYMKRMHLKNVGFIKHKSTDFYATRQRDSAGEQILMEEFPDVNICAVDTFAKESDAYDITLKMLAEHPEINGLYVSWEGPTRHVLRALADIGREDIGISTGDFSYDIALDLARGGAVKAISTQRPCEQGETIALSAANALLMKPVHSYIGVEPIYADKNNLEKAWRQSFGEEAPDEIKKALNWTYLNDN